MKIAYLDCPSGISGDMTLGALVDAGVELQALQDGVSSLGLPACTLRLEEVKRCGFRAAKVHVDHEPEHAHRHLHHIVEMIQRSSLTERQQDLAVRIFTRLGEAEAKVHGSTLRKVHFHEVGAVDSIADIVGAALGWDLLGVERLVCSPLPTGGGTIQIAHGRVNVPAPATAELLRGVPLAESPVKAELTTPTGAAIVTELAAKFGALPAMQIDRIGCGAGDKDFPEQANIARLIVGQAEGAGFDANLQYDQVMLLETNLDDCPGEWIGYCSERLWEAGALDVYSIPLQMKKQRPAVLLAVLAPQALADRLQGVLFEETGTLGVRRSLVQRAKLPRREITVETQFGPIAGKVAHWNGREAFAPEFESCRQAAVGRHVPLREVHRAALRAFQGE